MECWLYIVFLFIVSASAEPIFHVIAPNILPLDAESSLAIAVDGASTSDNLVQVIFHDYPQKKNTLVHQNVSVGTGDPKIVKVHLDPAKFPLEFFSDPNTKKFVSLTVESIGFRKEVPIPITSQSGYIFIQTDKPIYTPKETVHIRVIALNETGLLSDKPFKLQIRNPSDVTMEEAIFNQRSPSPSKFLTKTFKFPTYPTLGEWSAVVKYGYKFEQHSTVHFDLKEYVLPTFGVELTTPKVILPSHKKFQLSVNAKYVYGKKVKGLVTYRLGVQKGTDKPTFFALLGPYELNEKGDHSVDVSIEDFSKNGLGWFPEIEGSLLIVEATVTDFASGNKEVTMKANTRFSKSPFVISFNRSLEDFRPGFQSVFEANIFYVDGTPAKGIKTRISVNAINEQNEPKPLNISLNIAESDAEGKVTFQLLSEVNTIDMIIKLETIEPKHEGHQAVGTFKQSRFRSSANTSAYIALERNNIYQKKVGKVFSRRLHISPATMKDIYYAVISRRRVLIAKKLVEGKFYEQPIKFILTQEMVPHFRIIVWSHHAQELLADSLLLETEPVCHPNSEVSTQPSFTTQEPGSVGRIIIKGMQGTSVGLLGVDKAVYLLSKKSILTKSKMLNTFANHDLGCGPGGGLTTARVIGKAGVVIMTSFHDPLSDPSSACTRVRRRKRNTDLEMLENYSGLEKECCRLGMEPDTYKRSCEIRSNIIKEFFKGRDENCSSAFLDCCQETEDLGKGGEKDAESPLFLPAEEINSLEKLVHFRKDFRETWFFTNIQIPFENQYIFNVSLPDSITTWVIQAVSLSSDGYMCIAEPQETISFKKTFIQLNLPYSVVRNEQVEIQATVFNYGDKTMWASVRMYGVKGLCSNAVEGTNKSVELMIEKESAATAIFPVFPLETGLFNIQIKSLTKDGTDAISRQLNVVAEGYPKEIDFSIKLDPTNQQKRQKGTISNSIYQDFIDTKQNLQATAIKLELPHDFVPGTAKCKISAIGNPLGPVAQVNFDPENLINLPKGCCEQSMAKLAPLVYALKFLKEKKNISKETEEKAYDYIRQGYKRVISFRREDGSYSAYGKDNASTWLTAFVVKVLCQTSTIISIDENVTCSGVKWLKDQQAPDGSYIENFPVFDTRMVGGITGKIPLTAFVLIALEECDCGQYVQKLDETKGNARDYLEGNFSDVKGVLATAITTYALILSNSPIKTTALDKLYFLSKYDKDKNMRFWSTDSSSHDVEACAYALLCQVFLRNMSEANSIMNWLNSQQKSSSNFQSTQDTVIALQSMTEYLRETDQPLLNLVADISSSNDEKFKRILTFNETNALILQEINVQKVGGTLMIRTTGQGVGNLAVHLMYNVMHPPDDKVCKFDIVVNAVNATEKKEEIESEPSSEIPLTERVDSIRNYLKNHGLNKTENRARRSLFTQNSVASKSPVSNRVKRQAEKKDLTLNITVCTKFRGDSPTDMSIIEVGIFSGFKSNEIDLKKLEDDKLIDRYEITSKGVIFYLAKVPIDKYHCLHFTVTREFIVGSIKKSAVKVYDYYNPGTTCTKFYAPENDSPMLRTICTNGICLCAEGECPKKYPFEDVEVLDRDKQREKLLDMACADYNFVWIGKVKSVKNHGGFFNTSYEIEEVYKPGIEKNIDQEIRNFLLKDNCEDVKMRKGTKYLIMGNDGQQYETSFGGKWYRYILDRNSIIYKWKTSKKDELQHSLDHVTHKLLKEGCPT